MIDTIFIYHFVDLDLRVEIISRKEATTGNGSIGFEKGDIGNSAHWYWRLKKSSCRACLLFKIAFRSPFELYFYPFHY